MFQKKTFPKMRRMLSGEMKVVWCGKIEEGKLGRREVTGQIPYPGSLAVRRGVWDGFSCGENMLRLLGRRFPLASGDAKKPVRRLCPEGSWF